MHDKNVDNLFIYYKSYFTLSKSFGTIDEQNIKFCCD